LYVRRRMNWFLSWHRGQYCNFLSFHYVEFHSQSPLIKGFCPRCLVYVRLIIYIVILRLVTKIWRPCRWIGEPSRGGKFFYILIDALSIWLVHTKSIWCFLRDISWVKQHVLWLLKSSGLHDHFNFDKTLN